MDLLQKVVWSEGMFLAPHHFQQQDRYWENHFLQHVRAIQPMAYGLSDLAIDQSALALGELVITRASGIFPDGLVFSMPDGDELPASRSLDAVFSRQGAALDPRPGPCTIFLAVPLQRHGQRSGSPDGLHDGQPTRYRTSTVAIRDENGAGGEQEVLTARKNIRVVYSGEPLDNQVTIPIARLRRDGTGNRIELDPGYVPPALALRATVRVQTIVRHVLELLNARSAELAARSRQTGAGLIDLAGGAQLANFALLQTIDSAIPAIRHLHNQPGSHPERAFLELARLAGSLCAFTAQAQPRNLPLYVHDEPSECFNELERELQGLLDVVVPSRCLTLRLDRIDASTLAAELPAELRTAGSGASAAFYVVGAHGPLPLERVIRELPQKMKIASPEAMPWLVAQSIRGVAVQHLPVPPKDIPAKPDWVYFQIIDAGEAWNEIHERGRIALFLPGEFNRLELELLAVKGER